MSITVVFLITAIQSGSLINNVGASSLADAWVLYVPAMLDSEWGIFRMLGTAFLHIGPVHLAMNLILLFLFGRELEQTLGSDTFALSFLAGTLGASAAIIWMSPMAATAGASGAVYALMAQLVGVAVRQRRELRGLIALIAVNAGFTIIWSEWVSVWGHFGGLGIGIVLAIVSLAIRQKGVQLVVIFGVCVICFVLGYGRILELSTEAHVLTIL